MDQTRTIVPRRRHITRQVTTQCSPFHRRNDRTTGILDGSQYACKWIAYVWLSVQVWIPLVGYNRYPDPESARMHAVFRLILYVLMRNIGSDRISFSDLATNGFEAPDLKRNQSPKLRRNLSSSAPDSADILRLTNCVKSSLPRPSPLLL